MKTKIFLGLVMICFLLGSCFDDESSKNVEFLKPIQINDFSTSMELYVSQGGRLKIKTLAYKEGMDDAALSFEWKLQGHGQHETLGNTMILDTVINVPMNREAYSLLYTVTDTENELTVTKRYYLYVTGQYEAGLLVADTKDEQTSDLHLIIGKNFNRNYSKHEDDRVFENIYSINNGTKIGELVTDMKSVVAGYLETSIATEHSVEDLSPLDNFTVIRRNNDMFIKAFDGEFVVGGLNNCARGPYDVIAVNGHIHKRTQYEEATTYGVGMLLEDLTDDYYVTHYLYRPYNPYPGEGDLFGIAYDQKHHRFLAFPHFRSEDNLHIFRNTSADGKQDPLNRGFLGGMINEYTRFEAANDNRQTLPRFQPDAIRANMRIVEVLNVFGRTRGITPAQVALAWLMNKKPFIVPIPGTTKLSHLEENLRAAEIRFTESEMRELEEAVAAIPVIGSRYDALQESKVQK